MNDIAVVLPALNEEGAVVGVVEAFRKAGVARVIVVDNASTDQTAALARSAGAEVVLETRRGYGAACIAGLRHLEANPPAFVAFADCDGTLAATDLERLVAPLEQGTADLALGRRTQLEPGALPRHQKMGNDVACAGLRVLYGLRVHDVPPLRAMTWAWAQRLRLQEPTYGLPIETLAMTHRLGGRVVEVRTTYKRRAAGESKVSGSWQGSLRASLVIASLLLRLRFRRLPA